MIVRRNTYLILVIIVAFLSSNLWWISLKKSIKNSFDFIKLELISDINFQAEKISKYQSIDRPVFRTINKKNCIPFIEIPQMAPVPSEPLFIGQDKIPYSNLETCTHSFRKSNNNSELGDFLKVHVGHYTKASIEYFSLTLIFNDHNLKTRRSQKDYSLNDQDWFHLEIPDVSEKNSELSNIYITFREKEENESFYRPFIYSSKYPINYYSKTALSNIKNLSEMKGNLYECNDEKICGTENQYMLKLRMPIEKVHSKEDSLTYKIDILKPIKLVWHNSNDDSKFKLDTRDSFFIESLTSKETLKQVVSNVLDDILTDLEVEKNTVEVFYKENPFITFEQESSKVQNNNKYYIKLAEFVGIKKITTFESEDNEVRWPNIPNGFKVRITASKHQILKYWRQRVDQILKDHFWSFGSLLLLLITFIMVIYRLRSITGDLQSLNFYGDRAESLDKVKSHISRDEIGLLAKGLYQGLKSEQEKMYLEESKRKDLERLSTVLYHDIVGTYGPSLEEISLSLSKKEQVRHDYNLRQIIRLAEGLRDGIKVSEYKYDGSEEGSIHESLESCLKRYGNKIKNRCSPIFLAEKVISSDQLGACIDQLVSNAMNFTNDETPIEIDGNYSNNGLIVIIVKNKGPEIPQDLMKNNLLFRFGESGRGSTGVGLWVTQKRMESMNGSICVYNRPPYVEFELKIKTL